MFNNPKMRAIKLTRLQLCAPIAFLFLVDLICAVSLMSTVGFSSKERVINRSLEGQASNVELRCGAFDADSRELDGLLLGVITGVHILALCAASVVVWQVRRIDEAFSESKYVSIAVVSELQNLVLSILLFSLGTSVDVDVFVRTASVLAGDFSVLYLIFIPKMARLRLGQDALPKTLSQPSMPPQGKNRGMVDGDHGGDERKREQEGRRRVSSTGAAGGGGGGSGSQTAVVTDNPMVSIAMRKM